MDEIEVIEIIRWEWECPKCEGPVEASRDPRIDDFYYCEMCGFTHDGGL